MERRGICGEQTIQGSSGVPLEAKVDKAVVAAGEEIDAPVTEAVFSALPRLPSVDLTHHVERQLVDDLARMGLLPVRERLLRLLLEFGADLRFEMLGCVYSVAVK